VKLPDWIWIDGAYRRGDEPVLTAFDRGYSLGDGLYDTALGVDGAILHFDLHWERFAASAEALRMPLPFDADTMRGVLTELMQRNGLTAGRARLKMILTRGASLDAAWNLDCARATLFAGAWPTAPARIEPLRAGIIEARRDARDPLWQHKTINLQSRAFARADLIARGFDDGLILNTDGNVCEGTTSNVFALIGGVVVTPPVSDGLLPGTVRALLMRHAKELDGVKVAERPVTLDELLRADAVWFANAISPVQVIACLGETELTVSESSQRQLARIRAALDTESH
jgi:branched-chain amino acid aminotransferase